MLLMLGVPATWFTTKGHVPDGVPPEPLRTCTVKEPAAKVAGPLSVVALRVNAPDTTQDDVVEQPGPRKNTSAFEVLKLSPVIVKLNCPASGGLGEVVMLLIVGVVAAAFTVKLTVGAPRVNAPFLPERIILL
jgi:hypothetical protein